MKQEMIKKDITFWKGLVPIGIFFFEAIPLSIIFVLVGLEGKAFILATAIGKLLMVIAVLYSCKKLEINLFEKINFKWYFIVFVVLAALLNVLKGIPLSMIFGQTETVNGASLMNLMGANIIYFVSYTVLTAPFIEEVIFRGVMMKYLSKNHMWVGYLISSILFSLIHIPTDWFSFFNYFSTGLIMGGVYLLTKDLRWSIAAHILNNGIAVLFMLLATSL